MVVAAAVWKVLAPGACRSMDVVRTQWGLLHHKLPQFGLAPLFGLSCSDVDCIGIVQTTSDCVCY